MLFTISEVYTIIKIQIIKTFLLDLGNIWIYTQSEDIAKRKKNIDGNKFDIFINNAEGKTDAD